MKFYCKNRESEFKPGEKVTYSADIACPLCGEIMEKLPIYETPAQYEKRTGKIFPKNRAVYALNSYSNKWRLLTYNDSEIFNTTAAVVIADSPMPPSDDWRPEAI
jgi:hypothetical protein